MCGPASGGTKQSKHSVKSRILGPCVDYPRYYGFSIRGISTFRSWNIAFATSECGRRFSVIGSTTSLGRRRRFSASQSELSRTGRQEEERGTTRAKAKIFGHAHAAWANNILCHFAFKTRAPSHTLLKTHKDNNRFPIPSSLGNSSGELTCFLSLALSRILLQLLWFSQQIFAEQQKKCQVLLRPPRRTHRSATRSSPKLFMAQNQPKLLDISLS